MLCQITRWIVQCDHCQDRLSTSAAPEVEFTLFDSYEEARDGATAAAWEIDRHPLLGMQVACPDCQIELARAAATEDQTDRPENRDFFGPISALPNE